MRALTRALIAVAAIVGPAAIVLAAQPPSQPGKTSTLDRDFQFKELNHPYKDVLPPLAPVTQGPLTIQLRSPHQTLDLIDNEVHAHPNGDGTHQLVVDLEIAGRGELIADMSLAGMKQTLHDQVELPRQRKRIVATVRIHPTTDGYEITTVRLPTEVSVAIRSGVGDRIIRWCNRMAMIPFFAIDCDGLTQSLQTAVIPVPPPGGTYLLPGDQLSAEERGQIDAYLAANGGSPPPPTGAGRP